MSPDRSVYPIDAEHTLMLTNDSVLLAALAN